ncbi:structural protein [Sphingopyxis macrogoltabida]|uniref:Phage head morphogenesis domain-containing protein n=1 Tax=Sphingopyxis macrogoltabida TaxID=33050 RepID=A0AAC8Z0V4_SPHMC|nr:hypothetical protein [Sphingopyxis macrogoltabida]ALJ12636.1 hypothetical protein LH19_07130 [Sphingopyxis macrogoltabida]AMU89895.1 hypothetical protein ATM17_12700 [Sphingopyxis macrogoltabida]
MNDELQSLIDKLEPRLRDAFLAAIRDLRNGIDMPALEAALRAGDIDRAVAALNIENSAFSSYLIERQAGYADAGAAVSEQITKRRAALPKRETTDLPSISSPLIPPTDEPPHPPTLAAPGGGNVNFRFDMSNPRAAEKIRSEAASRVVGYVSEQVDTARKVIADGFARGEGPTTIATDIAGRVNPLSGRREGGIIGLSDPQAGYVENMRRRLQSGDADEMMKVLGRFDKQGKWVPGSGMTLRDRRFDPAIKKAITAVAAGKPNPLSDDKISEMVAKYSDRLVARRAEDIARTETAQGVMSARAEAYQQALDKEGLPAEAVEKTWRHYGDPENARDTHEAIDGKTVTGINAPFFLPDGSVMLHSHDPAGGVKNNANCRCGTDFFLNFAYGLT